MLVKFWAFNLTQSQAIFSDAAESIVNIVAAVLALFVIYYSTKPADTDHPYGHGKAEYFSSAFEGGLISFAGVLIIIEAVRALMWGRNLRELGFGLVIVGVAGLVNLLLGLVLLQVGKRSRSIALRASGLHVISDFWTSAGVVGGLLLVLWTGWNWIDGAIALILGGLLGYSGVKLVRESVGGLMDKEDTGLLKELSDIFAQHMGDGIIQIHHVKMIRSGWYHHIDAHVVLPEYWDVARVHNEITRFERDVIKNYEFSGEMNFHVDPCRRAYCRFCSQPNCPIRQEPFEKRMPVRLEDLRSPHEPEEFRSSSR